MGVFAKGGHGVGVGVGVDEGVVDVELLHIDAGLLEGAETGSSRTLKCRTVRSTCAVRETASLGIMGASWEPPLNPSESIVL